MQPNARRPGLRKARFDPVLRRRQVELWHSSDYRVRQMFERADVMSEGAPRKETQGQVYYGTTSIVLLLESLGGLIPDADHAVMVRLLAVDPHARVRAMRIAWREARVRCTAPFGQLRTELTFTAITSGVKIDVDVEAPMSNAERRQSTG